MASVLRRDCFMVGYPFRYEVDLLDTIYNIPSRLSRCFSKNPLLDFRHETVWPPGKPARFESLSFGRFGGSGRLRRLSLSRQYRAVRPGRRFGAVGRCGLLRLPRPQRVASPGRRQGEVGRLSISAVPRDQDVSPASLVRRRRAVLPFPRFGGAITFRRATDAPMADDVISAEGWQRQHGYWNATSALRRQRAHPPVRNATLLAAAGRRCWTEPCQSPNGALGPTHPKKSWKVCCQPTYF